MSEERGSEQMGNSTDTENDARPADIAVIGMAGRFPGAPNVDAFWQNLKNSTEAVRFYTEEELREAGESPALLADPNYVKASVVLDDIDKFDASFFGFSPRDASVTDPAHRFFLEVAWSALEHAGHTGLPEDGSVGVWAGSGAASYWMKNLQSNPDLMGSMGDFLVRHTGNDMNFMATRVSYEMDLRGPSINVQTACSTGLVSVHMACRALIEGDCDIALAGGSTILVPQGRGYLYQEGEVTSRDGHCRPFDEKSTGTLFGSGTGCVVLRRLQDALDDGDTIHAVIRGSAINNDGAVRVGFLAPGVDGQADCIAKALDTAGLGPEDISYIETHGTGTRVGDPIELEGLTQAFRRATDKNQFCAIGSVKSNIGHLGEAAGIASFIKAVMALKHRQIPKSLGYESPNPEIDFESTPFFVNTTLRDWQADGPRRCGVTSLGAGGTNCHVILEEPPPPAPTEGGRSAELLCLSGKNAEAVEAAAQNLGQYLETHPEAELSDVAFTLHDGRRTMSVRRALAVHSREDAIALLKDPDPARVVTQVHEGRDASVVFMFPGGGAQYIGMGRGLYEAEEVYRDAVEACLALLPADIAEGVQTRLLSGPEADLGFERISYSLPALFTTGYSLAKLYESWGVEPDAMVGHSLGEYIAACLSGVLTLQHALDLVCTRSRLIDTTERGGMMSVSLSEEALKELLPEDLDLAGVNAPELCVVSGRPEALDRFEKLLADQDVDHSRLHIDVAGHSSLFDPILDEFRAFCRTIPFEPPTIPYLSNLTGNWITEAEATDPEYWVTHLRRTVRFADSLNTLLAKGPSILLEVGPGRTLASLGRLQTQKPVAAINSMRHPKEEASDLEFALRTLGRVWASGGHVDWLAFYGDQLRQRLPLPTYPFQSESYWVTPGEPALMRGASVSLRKRPNMDDWFHEKSWSRKAAPPRLEETPKKWLIFMDKAGIGTKLVEKLEAAGAATLTLVQPGPRFVRIGERGYELDPSEPEHFQKFIEELSERDRAPDGIVYLWALGGADEGRSRLRGASRSLGRLGRSALNGLGVSRLGRADKDLQTNFWSLFYLSKALCSTEHPVRLSVVSAGMQKLFDEPSRPEKATLLGPVHTLPHESPNVATRSIDVSPFVPFSKSAERAAFEVFQELLSQHSDARVVAYRGGERWAEVIAPVELPQLKDPLEVPRPWLRENSVVLITGGLSGIGMEMAKHLAKAQPVKLVLFGRTPLPNESEWDEWSRTRAAGDPLAARIRDVQELRALGAEVMVGTADVADKDAMASLVQQATQRFGAIHGLIHSAGLVEDALLQMKTDESAKRVLSPKVLGTMVLDEVLDDRELDFFVLFSSVASFLGLQGQTDYTAANAFLDAFARDRAARAPGRTIVINWNAWREVGMAAAIAEAEHRGFQVPSRHPALSGYTDHDDSRAFVADFSTETHWWVDEHRIKGAEALIPGTGFVELVRAALEEEARAEAVELTDVTFFTPFRVSKGETRRLHLSVTPAANGAVKVTLFSESEEEPHATGTARYVANPAPEAEDVSALASRCDARVEEPKGGYLTQAFADFGPRWANIVRIRYGKAEALMELRLDPQFSEDLGQYRLHPALLDMATGGVQPLIPGFDGAQDFYVPLSYGKLRLFADMPGHVFSHVRLHPESSAGIAHFDVTLMDEDGNVFATVERFSMKKLDAESAMTAAPAARAPSGETQGSHVLDEILREAILRHEGVAVFDRIMAENRSVQLVASSVDAALWTRKVDLDAEHGLDDLGEAGGPLFARPNLGTPYVEPRDAAETLVAKIWSEILGVEQVGVNDSFYDLGGQSLLAVRMVERVKKETGAELPLTTLFESPTVATLAQHLDAGEIERGETTETARSSVVAVKSSGSRPPLFMPHGVGGTVHWGYANVARYLSPDQPVYGFQLPEDRVLCNFKEMASYYIEQMKERQPAGPYYLAGYCFGGNLAYEMATQLRNSGDEVALLAMIEAWPVNTEFGKVTVTPSYMLRFLRNVPPFVEEFAKRPPHRQVQAVKGKWTGLTRKLTRMLSQEPEATVAEKPEALEEAPPRKPPQGADMLDMTDLAAYADGEIEIWERNLHALWDNVPEPFDGKITVIRARRQPLLSPHDPLMGWGPLASKGVETHLVNGAHFGIVDEPDVKRVGEILEDSLQHAHSERATEERITLKSDPSKSGASEAAHEGAKAPLEEQASAAGSPPSGAGLRG